MADLGIIAPFNKTIFKMKLKQSIISLLPQSIRNRFSNGAERSKEAVRNIAVSMVTKGVSIIISFLIVPLTIDYVNPTTYGVWLTLSSIIGWISYLNLGLGNGFRNRFAEAKAKGDTYAAKQYVSTTYFAITCLVVLLMAVLLVTNNFLDWSAILRIDSSYSEELKRVFVIVCVFFCLTMVVNTFDSLLLADQKPGLSSIVHVLGQLFSLIVIFILTKTTIGNLTKLAFAYSSIPCITMLLISIIAFAFSDYKRYAPSINTTSPKLIGNILNIGIQFFFIYICLILIFQIINLVIARELGPDAVTQYNIAYKYFHLLYMVMVIIITPFWSAFTDAYTQKDYKWMKSTLHKLELCSMCAIGAGAFLLAISPVFFKFWVGESVHVPFFLSVTVLLYMLTQSIAAVYMQLINGIGTIRLQLIIYIVFAVISWPMTTLSCRLFGVYGASLVPIVVYIVQAVFGRIQLKMLLNNSATGIWNK